MADILFVDEDEGMRELVTYELSDGGHQLSTALGLEAAKDLIDERSFDLVISDVRRPLLDGVEVLKAAKQADPFSEVIAVTAHADVDSAVECVRIGAVDLLQKPFTLPELHNAVERALERRRLSFRSAVLNECHQLWLDVRRPLAERIADVAKRLTSADDVTVMLTDGASMLSIVYADGLSPEVVVGARIPFGEGIAGKVAVDRKPAVLSSQLADDPRFAQSEGHGRVRSAIVYPLIHDERLLGILNLNRVAHKKAFRRHDLEAVELLAVQAAAALNSEGLMRHLVEQERLAGIGQLSASIVHEIRNPLTYVAGNLVDARARLAGLIANAPEDASASGVSSVLTEVDAALIDVEEGVSRIQEIVRDVQGLARSESRKDRFSIAQAVRSAVRLVRPMMQGVAELKIDVAPDAGEVLGSADRLVQVIMNLLVNAVHAIEERQPKEGRIEVQVMCVGKERVVLSVSDNGCGIPASQLSLVTQAFFTTKPAGRGSGLGLAICRQIIEQHKGTLSVESFVDRGTTFHVTLPAMAEEKTEELSDEPLPRILIIEDEAMMRRVLYRVLRPMFRVDFANDGVDGLRIIEGGAAPSAVVSDVLMPRLTGIALYRHVKQRWPELAERMVMLTGAVLDDEQQRYLRDEGVKVLHKPVDTQQLKRVLTDLTGGNGAGQPT